MQTQGTRLVTISGSSDGTEGKAHPTRVMDILLACEQFKKTRDEAGFEKVNPLGKGPKDEEQEQLSV